MGELVPARAELIALACMTRRDWTYEAVEAALVRAHDSGWSWARTLTGFVGLMAQPDCGPEEFAPDPVRQPPPADPERTARIVAEFKAKHAPKEAP